MDQIKPSNRKPGGTPSIKLLLTVASVAATLGGWVAFSLPGSSKQDGSTQSLEASLNLTPIATIMPLPYDQPLTNMASNQPTNQQINVSTLRSVNPQPMAPITITRSSR